MDRELDQDTAFCLVRAVDAMNQLKWNKQLIDIAIEHTSTFNEKNFDRVCVLLDSFNAMWEGEFETLEWNLKQLLEHQNKST